MKKILYLATMLLAMVFTSCSKEEIGGTATQNVAGDWYVKVVGCDASDNIIYDDDELYGYGMWHCLTYNTAANDPTKMIIYDDGNFKNYMVVVNIDQATNTFATPNNDFAPNLASNNNVKITNGKIVFNGGKQNNGSPADYIEYNLYIDNDKYAGDIYDHLRVIGVRYSGLADND